MFIKLETERFTICNYCPIRILLPAKSIPKIGVGFGIARKELNRYTNFVNGLIH